MPFLNRDGVKLYYEVHGQGPPLLLTHGYSSTSTMWQGQIKAFSREYKLIIWDMRGHGQSDYPENQELYSEAHTVVDMLALLDEISPGQKAIIGGLSLGGYMSLAFYRLHPTRVSQLLIIDTGPGFKSKQAREAWNRTAIKTAVDFEQRGLDSLKEQSPERSTVTHRNAKGLVRAARGMLAQRDDAVILSLPRITVPTVVVVGSDDKPFLAASDYMIAKIPNAKKVLIAEAGHAVNIDQPAAFNAAIVAFLDDARSLKANM